MNAWRSRSCVILCFIHFLLGSVTIVYGQAEGENEPTPEGDQKQYITQQIQLTDELLEETQQKQVASSSELGLLNTQIRLRKRLLNQLNKEIAQQNLEITDLNEITCAMQEDIEKIKQEYIRLSHITYKATDTKSFWLSIFGSSHVREAYYRSIYFKHFSQFRKQQLILIESSQQSLDNKREELIAKTQNMERLLAQKTEEFNQLQLAQVRQKGLIRRLKRTASTYQKNLSDYRKKLKQLISQAEAEAGGLAVITNSDHGIAFSRNKGFHAWPLPPESGVVVGTFGETEDPHGNPITNDGIFIQTPQGQAVSAVYKGKVTGVQRIPLNGYLVIIEHGQYRSVYANLKSSLVKVGEWVEMNQSLGTVRTDPRSGETTLNFLVYKTPDVFEDPLTWIYQTSTP